MPTDQLITASVPRAWAKRSVWGSKDAAATATDWLATTQMNQVPLALATTGRARRPRTAVHGTTDPRTSQVRVERTKRIAVHPGRFASARRTPSTFVPAMKVKNPNARRGSRKSAAISARKKINRHAVNPSRTTYEAAHT